MQDFVIIKLRRKVEKLIFARRKRRKNLVENSSDRICDCSLSPLFPDPVAAPNIIEIQDDVLFIYRRSHQTTFIKKKKLKQFEFR